MKILIDPALSVLIKDFTDAQCAELLRCIFEYPNRDCDMGVWQYMKAQIKADEQKYKDKCQRVAKLNKKRMAAKSSTISSTNSSTISSVEEVEERRNKNVNKINEFKRSERRNAPPPVENSVENVLEFFIDENFSFEKVIERNNKFKDYLALFPASVVENAEQSFKKKRKGQWANIKQILEWIEKQHLFYRTSQGS